MSPLILLDAQLARSRRFARLALGLAICAGLRGFAASTLAASFTASLDRDTITLGESATLSLTFSGATPADVPNPPAVQNLQIDYVGPSSQFSVINGQVSSTVTHVFTVTPQQAGDYTIPSLAAIVGGENLSTQPVKLKVLKPGAPPPESISSGKEVAFLKLVLPKQEAYLGETIVAQLQLYLQDKVQNVRGFQLTGFPAGGFNAGKLIEGQRRQVRLGSSVYTVIPLAVTLKAFKTGIFEIGPVTASVVVELPSTNRRRDPFFDQFGFRDLFGGTEQKQLSLATEAIKLQALPLPTENIPPNFNGAVGSFTLNATAGPTNVAVGDPITLRVQISGRGALDALNLPEQTARGDSFKSYPPTSKIETNDVFGLQGTKTFEQVVVPQNPEVKELPPISFSFFDPEQKSYHTLTQPAVRLVVRPSTSAPAPALASATPANRDNSPPAQNIVHIKERLGAVAQIGAPLVQQPWFVALQGVPLFTWLSALVWRRRQDNLANNPRLRRQRQVAQIVRDGLIRLRDLAAANNSEEFFATLFRLLQEQLGERLDLPASAITEAVVEEHLRPQAVPETVLAPLQELFQISNLARYAPIKTSQELSAIIPKLESVLQQLQEANL